MNSSYFSLDEIALKINAGIYTVNVISIHLNPYLLYVENHFHKIYELHYVTGGSGTLTINNTEYTASQGMMYITGPDVEHGQSSTAEDVLMEYSISFEITDSKNSDEDDASDCNYSYIFKKLIETNCWIGKGSDSCFALWNKIALEANERKIGCLGNIKTCILQLIVETMRTVLNNPSSTDSLPVKKLEDKRITILDSSMLWTFSDTTLETLAEKLALSTKQTARLVKKHYGLSFEQRLTKSKLDMSVRFLTMTDTPINKIADMVGYSSIHYFSRRFKENYGISPCEFRNKYKSEDGT